MNSNELITLLQNAIDTTPHSDYHSGFTAKEIHRKCLVHIQLLDQTIQALMVEKDIHVYGSGWGKGKDE